MAEERAGLRKPKTPVEKIARRWATIKFSLSGMERMAPRPSEEVFAQHREFLREAENELKTFQRAGEDVESAKKQAIDAERAREIEQQALMQALARQNPGQTHFELGGKHTQDVYEQIVATPSMNDNRAERFTCNYCGKTSITKLKVCGRCRMVAYCSVECQKSAWKAHKKICKRLDGSASEPKTLPLTWNEVEAHSGLPVEGRLLEVRAILEESLGRQVFSCKDRRGTVRRVAAYTSSRRIPGLKQGAVIRWKNPRFHYFMDGSSGARIEEEDLPNITVKDS